MCENRLVIHRLDYGISSQHIFTIKIMYTYCQLSILKHFKDTLCPTTDTHDVEGKYVTNIRYVSNKIIKKQYLTAYLSEKSITAFLSTLNFKYSIFLLNLLHLYHTLKLFVGFRHTLVFAELYIFCTFT